MLDVGRVDVRLGCSHFVKLRSYIESYIHNGVTQMGLLTPSVQYGYIYRSSKVHDVRSQLIVISYCEPGVVTRR